MVDNPYEPHKPSPLEAGPGMLLRRGNGYDLPPIGNARRYEARHFRRQEWTGVAAMLLFVGLPFGWFLGVLFGWWGGF